MLLALAVAIAFARDLALKTGPAVEPWLIVEITPAAPSDGVASSTIAGAALN